MRKMIVLLIALLVISAPAFANLVVNSGFETGDMSGWSTWRASWSVGDAVSTNTVQKAFGAYCARMQFSNGEGSFGMYQVIPVAVGVQYDFSTWVRASVNSNNWAEVILFNYKVTDTGDIDSGSKSAPYLIWKRDSWGGVNGIAGGSLPTIATPGGPGNSWEYVNNSVTSSTGFVTVAYKWGRSGGGFSGGMFVDDVSLVQAVPEPASLLAFGTGLIGMAGFAIRRRR